MFRADRRFGIDRRGSASFTSFILALLNTTLVLREIIPTLIFQMVTPFAVGALSFHCC